MQVLTLSGIFANNFLILFLNIYQAMSRIT
jgi:hypothetical protein